MTASCFSSCCLCSAPRGLFGFHVNLWVTYSLTLLYCKILIWKLLVSVRAIVIHPRFLICTPPAVQTVARQHIMCVLYAIWWSYTPLFIMDFFSKSIPKCEVEGKAACLIAHTGTHLMQILQIRLTCVQVVICDSNKAPVSSHDYTVLR